MPPKPISKKASKVALSQTTSVSAPAFGKFASSTEPLILVDNLQETEDKFQLQTVIMPLFLSYTITVWQIINS